MSARLLAALIATLWSSVAIAEPEDEDSEDRRPTRWLARATPGFGYSWDREIQCEVQGRMFAGGFEVGYFVAPGVLVGLEASVSFNLLPRMSACGSPDASRFAMSQVIGPVVDWYPSPALGLHMLAAVGVSLLDSAGDSPDGYGIGAVAGLGYDWYRGSGPRSSLLLGTQLQVTMQHTFTASARHTTMAPALLFTFSFD